MTYASSHAGRSGWLEGGVTGEGSPTMMVDRRWRSMVRQPSPANRDLAKPDSSTYVTRGTYCTRERRGAPEKPSHGKHQHGDALVRSPWQRSGQCGLTRA
jgi:hypothetical protein